MPEVRSASAEKVCLPSEVAVFQVTLRSRNLHVVLAGFCK